MNQMLTPCKGCAPRLALLLLLPSAAAAVPAPVQLTLIVATPAPLEAPLAAPLVAAGAISVAQLVPALGQGPPASAARPTLRALIPDTRWQLGGRVLGLGF
jgi:hypothetical protein